MEQLSKTQSILLLLGGMMMVVCAGVMMAATLNMETAWAQTTVLVAPWAFVAGSVLFVAMQRMQRYRGTSITVRRLRSIQLLSGICFIVAGLLMVENFHHLVQPYVVSTLDSYFTYLQIVHNNWVVLMLIGAVLQMYTAHRISSEMEKDS